MGAEIWDQQEDLVREFAIRQKPDGFYLHHTRRDPAYGTVTLYFWAFVGREHRPRYWLDG